jgi:chromosome segregation ATPase
MSDKERLNLLKDVAGTKVYEQKRSESTRIMEETGEQLDFPYGREAECLQTTSVTKLESS